MNQSMPAACSAYPVRFRQRPGARYASNPKL